MRERNYSVLAKPGEPSAGALHRIEHRGFVVRVEPHGFPAPRERDVKLFPVGGGEGFGAKSHERHVHRFALRSVRRDHIAMRQPAVILGHNETISELDIALFSEPFHVVHSAVIKPVFTPTAQQPPPCFSREPVHGDAELVTLRESESLRLVNLVFL